MADSVVSIFLLVAVIGLYMLNNVNADREYIDMRSFSVGNCVKVAYTAPPTGRISVNLHDTNGDVALHVDLRVEWRDYLNTVLLNTHTEGAWETAVFVSDIKSTPGTVVEWVICAQENDFSVNFNQKELATYDYRTDANVSNVEFQSYEYESALKHLCVIYS